MSERCNATVLHRDTYRYTGRGVNGLELHYTEAQCKRAAGIGDLCRQHAEIDKRGGQVVRWDRERPSW